MLSLIFVSLFGLIDPPREDAIDAITQCKLAGIRVVMITGDNQKTAEAIADEMGMEKGLTLLGEELKTLSEDQLVEKIDSISIFARIEPLHKLRIVNAYKKRGHVVAMTGDGVNDAPALESADIGIAMGQTGTDVAKEASDMILADDDFASVEYAIIEGRALFNRLRNVTGFLLTTCFGELLVLILSILFLGKSPLTPLQILWINLLTGGIIAIPIGLEPKTGEELQQPPRDPKVGLIYPGMIIRIAYLALLLGASTFLIFTYAATIYPLEKARTVVFTSIVVFEWLIALSSRSDEISLFKLGLFTNRWLFKAILLALILQLTVLYFPPFQEAFKTSPLHGQAWILILLPGLCIFFIETLRKAIAPKLFGKGKWKR